MSGAKYRKLPDHGELRICLKGPGAPELLAAVSAELAGQAFSLSDTVAGCQVAIFLDTGKGLAALADWLYQTEPFCEMERLVCMPHLSRRVKRGLRHTQGVCFLVPGGSSSAHFRARILGELYPRLESKPVAGMVGQSPAMLTLLDMLTRFAHAEEPILITGPTGSGKELCARFLFQKRGRGSLVNVNCTSLHKGLAESELFGNVKGAFTGAETARDGLLEEAGEGICFLDEIGDLPLETQGVLLRVIQDKEVRRVGATTGRKTKARLVFATHVDLERAIGSGDFRSDLYYRINSLTIPVPPLKDRLEDIPLLVCHFLAVYNEADGKNRLPPKNFDCFFGYHWPGNIRELEGDVRDLTLMQDGDGKPLNTARLEKKLQQKKELALVQAADQITPFYENEKWEDAYSRFRKAFLTRAKARCGGVNAEMVAMCGCKKTRLYEELKRYNIPLR